MIHVTSTALELFGLTLHWYGLIIALGICLGVLLACLREVGLGLPRETSLDLALIGVPAAIVGARIYFVIFSWEMYAADPISMLYIWEGGLAIYGGIIGALLAGGIYARIKKLSFLKLADLAAPCIALGQAIGRWGNFVNQEAYGPLVQNPSLQFFPVAVYIDRIEQWHYATFFYESVWCAVIVAILLILERRGLFRRSGDTFFSYVFLYGLERAFVEGLRTDSLYLGPLRISQVLSIAALIYAGVMLFGRSRSGRKMATGMLTCSILTALLLISGYPAMALISALFSLIFALAMYIKDQSPQTSTKRTGR